MEEKVKLYAKNLEKEMGDFEEHGNICNASERERKWKRIIKSILIEG